MSREDPRPSKVGENYISSLIRVFWHPSQRDNWGQSVMQLDYTTCPTDGDLEQVKESAYRLLTEQRVTVDGHTFTTPSVNHEGYVGRQWFWDSCFHAYVLAEREPGVAKEEVRSMLANQRADGFIPHMNYFNGDGQEVPEGFKDLVDEYWSSPYHSDMVQPPIIAMAVERIYARTGDKEFLKEVLPQLENYYKHLKDVRDPDGDELLSIYHSWESGWDNSQRWDSTYGVTEGTREEIGEHKMRIFKECQEQGWNEKKILANGSFEVKPVDFNVLYAKNVKILASLSKEIGRDATWLEKQSAKTTDAIFNTMYDGDKFCDILSDGTLSPVKSAAMFYPMLLDRKFDYSKMIDEHLTNTKEFWAQYGISTTSMDNDSYDPDTYWRGNVWLNVNWFVMKGLENQGRTDLAKEVAHKTVDLVKENDWWEHYNPENGKGGGAKPLAWDCVVYDMVDLLQDRPDRV